MFERAFETLAETVEWLTADRLNKMTQATDSVEEAVERRFPALEVITNPSEVTAAEATPTGEAEVQPQAQTGANVVDITRKVDEIGEAQAKVAAAYETTEVPVVEPEALDVVGIDSQWPEGDRYVQKAA